MIKLRKNTEPDPDMVPAESLTVHEKEPKKKLQSLIYAIWGTVEFIHAWKTSVIHPIHKIGDILNCANYRAITFLKTAYEICTNTLHQKSKAYAEELTGDYRSGIRRERSASCNIFCMWQTVAKCWACNIPLSCMFIDSQTAYDKIIIARLWLAISMVGFPKYIRNTGQISNRRTRNFIYSNLQSNINIILLKQWSETRQCPGNTVI
jgi:hypothetical protein